MTKHAEELAKLGWQYFECPACGSEGARAFPKPEQEPVAWAGVDFAIDCTPPQRPWVGLTEPERLDCYDLNPARFVSNIEDKLRSKNT